MKATLKFRFTVLRFRLFGIWLRISRYKLLKFDLDDFDDRQDHLRCVKAMGLCLALWDFDQWLRSEIKHNGKEHLQEARDGLWRQMDEYNISPDELMT